MINGNFLSCCFFLFRILDLNIFFSGFDFRPKLCFEFNQEDEGPQGTKYLKSFHPK